LKSGKLETDTGVDVKWSPLAGVAMTERSTPTSHRSRRRRADRGQRAIRAVLPEKRPFFLEGVDLFSTPFTAVYTRTVTSRRPACA